MKEIKPKPYTGTVSEIDQIPFAGHCGWDSDPAGAGAVPVPEKGPAMRRNAAQRAQAEQDNEEED
jgi:hypothetical protein